MTRSQPSLLILAFLAACPAPPTAVEGTVLGHGLDVQDAVILRAGAAGEVTYHLFLGNRPYLCQKLKDEAEPKGFGALHFVLQQRDAGALVEPTPGAYAVTKDLLANEAKGAEAAFTIDKDDGCDTLVTAQADSGTLTLEAFDGKPGGTTSGTFDLRFVHDAKTGDGESIHGSFVALFCDTSNHGWQTCAP